MPVCNFCDSSFDFSQIEEGYLTKIGSRFLCLECLDDLKYALDIKKIENEIDLFTWTEDEIEDIALGETKKFLREKELL